MKTYNCNVCSTPFERRPSQVAKSKSGNLFCSRSCSATFNNKLAAKNKPKPRSCIYCGEIYFNGKNHSSRTRCLECKNSGKGRGPGRQSGPTSKTLERTLKECYDRYPSRKQAQTSIRDHCRSWNKSMTKLSCGNPACNYSVHVELAHRKDVAKFPDSATLGEVNHPNNVIQLCRNCHWEFDHGILVL